MDNAQQVGEVVTLARLVLDSTSDRDVLGVSHAGLLTRQSIQTAFQRRALGLHPDKTPAVDSDDARAIGAAFGKLTEARTRLLDLLPLVQLLWQAPPMSSPPTSSGGGAGSAAACYGAAPSSPTPLRFNLVSEDMSAPSFVASPSVLSASSLPFSSTKCRIFGCLRCLTAEDVQAQRDVCLHCRTQPKKCAVFGCLRMVSGDAYCSHHRP